VRRLIWTFVILTAVSAATAVGLWIDLRGERSSNAALRARLAEMAHSAGASAMAPRPPAEVAPLAAANQAALKTTEASSPLRVYVPSADDEAAQQRKLLTDLKYREAWREQRRVMYAPRRTNLVQVVGLTPEQADAVLDVQIDRELRWIESGNVDDRQAKADEAADQQRLSDLLGEEKRQALQNYMESRATRMRVDDFRSELAGANALRDDQVEPLIAALHVEDARVRQEMDDYRATLTADGDSSDAQRKFDDRQIERLQVAYERMHSAAAPILTSSQLNKFDAMLKRDLDRRVAAVRLDSIRTQVDQVDQVDQGDASMAKPSSH
jgi:hypothetical protein